MISTANIEAANSVNDKFLWKKVTKGFRSANRRPRKIYQILNRSPQNNVKGTKEKPTVTKLEEFKVDSIGQRFSEKIDHLPIKKRRIMQQSLSPPSCNNFDRLYGVLGKRARALGGWLPVINKHDEKYFLNKKSSCSEDSYGIELLAAAACKTSNPDDVSNVNAIKIEVNFETFPRSDESIHATSVEKNIVCSQKENSLFKDLKVDTSLEENIACSQKEEPLLKDTKVATSFEENVACSQKEISFAKEIKAEDHADSREKKNYLVVSEDINDISYSEALEAVRLQWDLNKVMDEWELPPEFSSKLLKCSLDIDIISKLKYDDSCISSGSDQIPSESPFLEKLSTPTTKMTVKVEDNCLSSDLQLGQILSVESLQLGKERIAMVEPIITEKTALVELNFDENKISELVGDGNTKNIQDIVGALVDTSSEVEVNKLEHKSCDRICEDSLDNFLDDGDVSDYYSPNDHHNLVKIEKITNYRSGYESPVEDGELRESKELSNYGKDDSAKESSHSVTTENSAERDQIYEDCEQVDKTVEAKNMKLGDIDDFDSTQNFEVKGSLKEKLGSRVTRGKSPGSRGFEGKNNRDKHRSSAACFQDDNNWDSKNNYQNNYRRGGNFGQRRNYFPEANEYQRLFNKSNYSRGGYRPSDHNHNFVNRGNFATRDDSPYENRGRNEFCRRGYIKENKDQYHDTNSNDLGSFSGPHRNSFSRSSPLHLDRERNVEGRRFLENRMLHYDDSRFLENNNVFLSPRRRFLNDQNSGREASFRERESPGRFFGLNSAVGRIKTDDGGFRPRFSEQSGGGLRRQNNNNNYYNNNYDGRDIERRYNNKHEMVRRVRHSETGGAGKRFRNSFEDHYNIKEYNNKNSCIRSSEKSDALGNGDL